MSERHGALSVSVCWGWRSGGYSCAASWRLPSPGTHQAQGGSRVMQAPCRRAGRQKSTMSSYPLATLSLLGACRVVEGRDPARCGLLLPLACCCPSVRVCLCCCSGGAKRQMMGGGMRGMMGGYGGMVSGGVCVLSPVCESVSQLQSCSTSSGSVSQPGGGEEARPGSFSFTSPASWGLIAVAFPDACA